MTKLTITDLTEHSVVAEKAMEVLLQGKTVMAPHVYNTVMYNTIYPQVIINAVYDKRLHSEGLEINIPELSSVYYVSTVFTNEIDELLNGVMYSVERV